jgi:hypothetical protein
MLLCYGAYAKLRKATVSFVMTVCELLLDRFPWNLIFVFVENLSRTFNDYNVSSTTGTLHEDIRAVMIVSR